MSEDSVLHGLNIDEDALHGDLHRSSGAASSVNRDLELAMWTNLHFPEEPIFSPERDQASKSRHKLVDSPPLVASSSSNGVSNPAGDPVANGFGFFGSVGASLLPEMGRGKPSTPNQLGMTGHGSLHDLFSWGMFDPSAHQTLFGTRPDVTVDPFLSNTTTTTTPTNANNNTNSNEGASGSGTQEVSPYTMAAGGLPPLTIKDVQGLKAKQAALMAQNPHAIDPANTTIAPPPAKRARLPSLTTSNNNNSGNMIPVNYTHPQTPTLHTALSGSDAGLDDEMETSPLHAHVHGHSHSLSLDGQMNLDKNMSPAEDKRRRNTLASARFRAKKKEREAAMERKARELDEKVLDLERECEVLRKENNWLKGLVVGASTTTPPNGATAAAAVTEEPAPVTTIKESASAPNGPSSGVVEAAKGSVIDVDELLRVLKASGAVLTGSAVNGAEASAQKQGPTPATGKRKRSSAAANN